MKGLKMSGWFIVMNNLFQFAKEGELREVPDDPDDLVDRLNASYAMLGEVLHKEAADRIEQLEAALREIADFELHGDYSNAYEIQPIARAALGEKKPDPLLGLATIYVEKKDG
jgi:hypothetical protein